MNLRELNIFFLMRLTSLNLINIILKKNKIYLSNITLLNRVIDISENVETLDDFKNKIIYILI